MSSAHRRPRTFYGKGRFASRALKAKRFAWYSASARWEPDARGLQPGCMGLLDTETSSLEPLTDDWLAEFPTPFDFAPWFDEWN